MGKIRTDFVLLAMVLASLFAVVLYREYTVVLAFGISASLFITSQLITAFKHSRTDEVDVELKKINARIDSLSLRQGFTK